MAAVASFSGLQASALITVGPQPLIELQPSDPVITDGATQTFSAYLGPQDASGHADVGADSVPGTSDDQFTLLNVFWSLSGSIGTLSTLTGSSTVLTGSLPAGMTSVTGQVTARFRSLQADANVTVTAPPILALQPKNVTLAEEESQTFSAYQGPTGAGPGPDGMFGRPMIRSCSWMWTGPPPATSAR
jgi:hypothetical protein